MSNNLIEDEEKTAMRWAWTGCVVVLFLLGFILWLTTGCGPAPHPQPQPRVTPTATSSLPTVASPTALYSPLPPKVTMRTSGETETRGKIDITEHFVIDPDSRVLDEIPSRGEDALFWRGCDHSGNCGVANCDPEHWVYPENAGDLEGQPTINWWNCGGSVKYGTVPRAFDLAGPFVVTHSPGVSVIYGRTVCDGNGANGDCDTLPGCFRKDWFNLCYTGVGTVTVCLPPGAKTTDGVVLRVAERCGTWPVR